MNAYNQTYTPNYFNNTGLQPYQQQLNNAMSFNNSQALDTGIIWVQGESGAKAYPVAPGKSMALFDSESERFFIKSVDISGMPQPLRMFNYSETSEQDAKPQIDTSIFITREEFEEAINQLKQKPTQQQFSANKQGGNRNGKPFIHSNEQYSNKPIQ